MSEELTLLPCPACGNRATVLIHDNQITYAAKCNSCGMSGPQTFIREVELSEMVDKATRYWNALPRFFTWTKEPPQAPGWYFVLQQRPNAGNHVFPVWWDAMVGSPEHVLKWAGPIPMPKESTE